MMRRPADARVPGKAGAHRSNCSCAAPRFCLRGGARGPWSGFLGGGTVTVSCGHRAAAGHLPVIRIHRPSAALGVITFYLSPFKPRAGVVPTPVEMGWARLRLSSDYCGAAWAGAARLCYHASPLTCTHHHPESHGKCTTTHITSVASVSAAPPGDDGPRPTRPIPPPPDQASAWSSHAATAVSSAVARARPRVAPRDGQRGDA